MFNTNILLSSFIYAIILFLLFLISLFRLLREERKTAKIYFFRFCILMLCGFMYNIVEGLLPNDKYSISVLSQNTIAWCTGVIVAVYYLYFLQKESNIFKFRTTFILLLAVISLVLFLFLFIIPYVILNDLDKPRFFFLFPIIIILFLLFFKLRKTYAKSKFLRLQSINSILGFLGILNLPLSIIIFGDNQLIEQTAFSFGFLPLSINFFLYNYVEKERGRETNKIFLLSSRELEIFNLLKSNENMKYREVADLLHISEKTVTSHMSRIYRKLEINGKKDLMEKIHKEQE